MIHRCISFSVSHANVSHDLVRYNGSENYSSTTLGYCVLQPTFLSLFLFLFFFLFSVFLFPLVVIYDRIPPCQRSFTRFSNAFHERPSALVKRRKNKHRLRINDGKIEIAATMSYVLIETLSSRDARNTYICTASIINSAYDNLETKINFYALIPFFLYIQLNCSSSESSKKNTKQIIYFYKLKN